MKSYLIYTLQGCSFWPVWPNDWVFVYNLRSCGLESRYCHLNFLHLFDYIARKYCTVILHFSRRTLPYCHALLQKNSLIAFFKLVLKKWKLALTITTFFFLRWKKSKTFFYHLISSLSNKIQIIVIWKSNFKQQNKFAFQTKPIHVTLHKKWTQGKKTPKINSRTHWRFWI